MGQDAMSDNVDPRTVTAFKRAVLGETSGYPDNVAFVSSRMEGAERVLWRHLRSERIPTVLAGGDAGVEVLIVPERGSSFERVLDALLHRVRVHIYWRVDGDGIGIRTYLGRHALEDIERRPPALV
jgi:hypothetical protein